MSENTPKINRPLTDVETEEFRALGLSPGHWIALAPLPLFRSDLNSPRPDDLQTLAKIQQPLRVEASRQADAERFAEAESFWKRLCQRSLSAEAMELANALLAWYLATWLPRPQRETFLNVLDNIATRFFKSLRSPAPHANPSYVVRQRIERYLPHPAYTRYPADPRIAPPNPNQVAEVFGADLWKQMLVAPIVAALGELQVRPTAAASVADVLAHVTLPYPYNKPYPLEPYLASGCWRRLFEGLLNPLRREATEPTIQSGLDIAASGLASLPFAERESLLQIIHEQIERGIDRSDQKRVTADEWIDRMRTNIEEVIRQAAPITGLPPPPPRTVISPHPTVPPASAVSAINPRHPTTPMSLKPDASPPLLPVSPPTPPKPSVAVELAKPFTTIKWKEALAIADRVRLAEIMAWLENPQRPAMLFDDQRSECSEVAIVRDAKQVPPVLWVIGDLHADVLTLANIIAHAERVATVEGSEPPSFVFLGDFVDRGRHDHEALLLLFQLILKDPSRVCVIPGNHDIDLQWDEKGGRFRVTIEPAEYCERLNAILRSEDSGSRDRVEFAKLLIAFWQSRPKAAILPDGTLFAHGGFPHSDMQGLLHTPADLARPNCLNDFLWARIAETARKRPNRGNRGHEFGWETLAQFCKVSTQLGVPPIKRFVRGHDHVPKRWQSYPDYAENPVLTINAMGRRMDGESDPTDGPHPFPVMARYVPNQLPIVVQLPLDANEVNRAFGKDISKGTIDSSEQGAPTPTNNPDDPRTQEQTPLLPPSEAIDEVAGGVRLDPLHNMLPKPGVDPEN
ncbi:MAG TPA: metallophosphoesterase [Gemmata sp.]|jgi:hypothetical protein|nr:metallophosphoesterase [Gemmata sp.]